MQCAVRRLACAGLLLGMFATACATSGSVPEARHGHTAVLDQAGGRMLVFGGYSYSHYSYGLPYHNSLHAYNISGDSWSLLWPGGNWPSARYGHTAVLHESGGRMLVFGGRYAQPPVSNLHAYDLVSNSWSELLPTGPQPGYRWDHTAILDESGGRMLVYGGSDGSIESLVSNNHFVYAYNLSDDSWSYHVPHDLWGGEEVIAPNDRWQHTAVLDKAGGRMLVFAGYGDTQGGRRRRRRLFSSHFGDLKDLWAYDLASNSWTELASFWYSPANHAAVLDEAGGRMLVSLGSSGTGNWVAAYDLAGNSWSQVWASPWGSGSPPRAFRSFSAVLEQGCGQMFVYGGETRLEGYCCKYDREITVFHTASDSWSSPTACTSTSTTTTVSLAAPATVTMSSSTTLTSSSTSSATFTSTSATSATLTATSLTPSATTSASSVTTTLTSTSTTSATFTTASLTSSTVTTVTSLNTTSTLSPTSTTSETFAATTAPLMSSVTPITNSSAMSTFSSTSTTSETFTTTASLASSVTSVTSASTMSTFSSTSTTSATLTTTSLTPSTTASTALSILSTLSSTSAASTSTSATTNSQTTATGTGTTTTLTAGTRTTTLTAGTLSSTPTTSASSGTTFTSSASRATATTTTSSSPAARGAEGGGGGLTVGALATAATGGALALLVLGTVAALKSRWCCYPTDPGGNRPDPGVLPEKTFRGKAGRGPAAVVSCPGAEDEDIGFGKGEVFAMVTAMQDLAVSVVFVEAAHIAEFWPLYLRALHEYATDKKYIVVLTKQNGGIGNVQRQEVTFLAGCDGRTVPGAEPRPNFRKGGVHVMAMTFRQLVAWQRLGFNETALGKAVPAAVRNKFVKELPSLAEMEEKFARLVADAE